MMRALLFLIASVICASAQQIDPTKLIPILKQQREMAADGVAACSALVNDQQAKITELEKQLAEAKAKKE